MELIQHKARYIIGWEIQEDIKFIKSNLKFDI